jgi:hypothetical protein
VSSSIWTRCAARSSERALLRRLRAEAWRVVEAQHVISTRKLVDSDEEQRLLEELLDRSKPAAPRDAPRGLHYLLATPFRYPPLRHGSRFGARSEPGVWYGSEQLPTAFAEAAYYRLVFLQGTTATLSPLIAELSAFSVPLATAHGVDLTRPPFDAHRAELGSPTSYAATQQLGREMRAAGVEAFRYRSARDPRGGCNLGCFSPRAFAARRPRRLSAWTSVTTPERVEIARKDLLRRERYAFPRATFEVAGVLPQPAT